MPQNNNAAQPLLDWVQEKKDAVKKAVNWFAPKPAPAGQPAPAKPVDTSWHDDAVSNANQSFADAAKKDADDNSNTPRPGKRMIKPTPKPRN